MAPLKPTFDLGDAQTILVRFNSLTGKNGPCWIRKDASCGFKSPIQRLLTCSCFFAGFERVRFLFENG